MPTTSLRKRAHIPWEQMLQQLKQAADLMARYEAYARSIGCEVVQDAVACDTKQAAKLAKWWEENARSA